MFRFFRTAVPLVSLIVLLAACGSNDIRKSISMEYLEAKPSRPVVYPPGVDTPEISDALNVPALPSGNQGVAADINELVSPPSLLTPEQREKLASNKNEVKRNPRIILPGRPQGRRFASKNKQEESPNLEGQDEQENEEL
jgi:uncharacterized lipoprotein